MSLPYLLRLFCVCAASFFLVHAFLGLAVSLVAPASVRCAMRMRPLLAVRLLLAMRLLPFAIGVFVVVGLCVPSYLWLEPAATTEHVGLGCVAAAVLEAILCAASAVRVFRALAGTIRFTRQCERTGEYVRVGEGSSPLLVIEGKSPVLALAGVLHPRLVVSRGVMDALSREQLDAALSHEQAHRVSCDNLKRFLLLLAPEILPFFRGFAALDRGWARLSEWAADDFAAAADSNRSLLLASALVRMARMGLPPRLSAVCTTFVSDSADLADRVNRLLRPSPLRTEPFARVRIAGAGAACLLGILIAAMISRPVILSSVHELLEKLIH
jgi:Zn-dependent protease with chaperone function